MRNRLRLALAIVPAVMTAGLVGCQTNDTTGAAASTQPAAEHRGLSAAQKGAIDASVGNNIGGNSSSSPANDAARMTRQSESGR